MTFEKLQQDFLRELIARQRKRATLHNETNNLRQFIAFCESHGLSRLSEVALQHVLDYYVHLQKYAPLCRYAKLGTVRRWLKWAHHRDHLIVNPLSSWQPRHPAPKLRWVPTVAQMQQVLDGEDKTARRFLLELLYGSGLRVQECSGLDLDDLDLAERQLRVRHGKGDKPRWIPLGAKLCEQLQVYLDQVRPATASQALFLNAKDQRMHSFTLSKWVRQAGQRCGFEKFTVHTIRRAYASHLLQAGAPLHAVKELLGHGSFRSTQLYTRVADEDLSEMLRQAHPRARRKLPRK
jgi:site-specific recombinase XerD